MKKSSLLLALPIFACGLAFTACSDNDIEGNPDKETNNGKTTLILNTSPTATVGSRAIANSKYNTIEKTGWGNPKYTYVSEGQLESLDYSFAIGDLLYAYDKNTGLESTFKCIELLNGGAAKFESVGTANVTAGQPLYLFTAQTQPAKQDNSTFKFSFAEQNNKGFIFGQNKGNVNAEGKNDNPGAASADITKSQFIGVGKINVPNDFNKVGTNYVINGVLDETPVMIAYYGDLSRDFDHIRLVKSFRMDGTTGKRGHYTNATYNIDSKTWTPGDFVQQTEAIDFDTDNNNELGKLWLGGNTMYMPILPGNYKEMRLTVEGQGKNIDGYSTQLQFKAVKNDFTAEMNKFYNVGAITGYQKSEGAWPDMDASDLWIHGAATPYGWAKKHTKAAGEADQEESRTWTTSQKMKRQANGDFVYIGYSLGNGEDWQTNPFYDNQRKGDGSYKLYFVNNGLYEAAGLVPIDGSNAIYNPGFGTSASTSSIAYYSSRVNAVRTVNKWWMSDKNEVYENTGTKAAPDWYKFTVSLKNGKLSVEKYTGATPSTTYFDLKKSATDHTIVSGNVYRLWMLGTATNLSDNGVGSYASSQAIAMNYNLAVGKGESTEDTYKFCYKGRLKQGYLQLLWQYGYDISNTHNNLTPDFSGSEAGVNIPSGAGSIYAFPVTITSGTAQKFHVEDANGKNGQWYIPTEGYYKIEVDLSNNTVKFTQISEQDLHY